jgi:hypothetical protein
MNDQMEKLIREEGLDDLDRLLTPREWDEVPLVSRLDRIAFLADMDVREKSRALVTCAVEYLDRVEVFANAHDRDDVVVMVSVVNWEDLDAADPDPVIPNFWISTHVERDLGTFRLRAAVSEKAVLVAAWLRSEDLLRTHEVFDSVDAVTDPELFRVYIARRASSKVERFVTR